MILGHTHIVSDLKNLAKKNALSHAYLFWGPPMIGKRTVAVGLAHFLETGKFEAPDSGVILYDTLVIHPDSEGAIGIDAVRSIKSFLWQKPTRSFRRTVLINDAQKLTPQAQDALLKTTENPPASALIILIANHPEELQPTLLSRLESRAFTPLSVQLIKQWLIEKQHQSAVSAEKAALLSLGAPGRAFIALTDPELKKRYTVAKNFFDLSGVSAKAFLKDLVNPDTFKLDDFLDSLIECAIIEKKYEKWHDILTLRENAGRFNLNPRIQLEKLITT